MALLVTVALLIPGCRPKPPSEPKTQANRPDARQQRTDNWLDYWKAIGVTDRGVLERIRQSENKRNQEHRTLQRDLAALRNELKIRSSEHNLSRHQSDSLMKEIVARLEVIERAGVGYWNQIDSLLTPEQRNNRINRIKAATDQMMNRGRSARRGDSFDLRGADTFGP